MSGLRLRATVVLCVTLCVQLLAIWTRDNRWVQTAVLGWIITFVLYVAVWIKEG